MSDEKKFNWFIFLSMLARSLIEVFIPIILYQKGVSIQGIFLFLIINFFISFILSIPLGYIAIKITFKWLMAISSIFIGIAYYFLFLEDINLITMIIIIIAHVINAHTYWIARHYYALNVLPKTNMGDEVGNIIILTQLSLIPASYVGALLMNKIDMRIFLIIVIIMYIIGIIPLFMLKRVTHKENKQLIFNIKQTLINFPKKSLWFLLFAQFRIVSRYLFPLYIYIYVRSEYEYIGLFNIALGIASMVFVYFFSRKIDRDKKDYLILSGILSCIVYIFKLNVATTLLMLIAGFFEGLIEKMYETSFSRNLYALGKNYNTLAYAVIAEGLQHLARTIIMLIFFFFIGDLKIVLYITTFMLVATGLIGFDDGEGGY